MRILSFLKRQYRLLFAYLKMHRKWCWLTAALIVGVMAFVCITVEPDHHYEEYLSATEGLYNSLFAFILFENLQASLMVVAFGMAPFGWGVVLSTYSIFAGLVATGKVVLAEMSLGQMLLCLAPHGVFEFSALFFGIMLSVLWSRAITLAIIRQWKNGTSLLHLGTDAVFLLRGIVLILIPLVFLAAVMEVTVSPWVMSTFI